MAADRVAAAFTSAVDGLLDVALTSLPGLALIELLGRVETQLRRMTSFDHALVTALVDSDACVDVGARNTAAVLVQALRVSPSEAAARVRAAKDLGPRTDFTGGPMEPLFEHVAAAQADGFDLRRPRPGHHQHGAGPAVRGADRTRRAAGTVLGRPGPRHAPDYLAKTAKHALTVLDPDGTLSSDEDHHRRRAFTISPRPDGSADVRGRLTPQCAAIVLAALDPLASPRPDHHRNCRLATAPPRMSRGRGGPGPAQLPAADARRPARRVPAAAALRDAARARRRPLRARHHHDRTSSSPPVPAPPPPDTDSPSPSPTR